MSARIRCSAETSFLATLVLLPAALAAQAPGIGEAAPPITLDAWLNIDGKAPTLESLAGRVVMLEFWGTWCGPCVAAMPEVQKLHDRYQERGLTVLAISYEPADKMRPFLEKNAYTMPVGSDPVKGVIRAYGIKGWPTTFLIGKDGKIAWVGSPYGALAAIEKELGLEASPATLLTHYVDAAGERDKAKQRDALHRLLEKAPASFDLRAWALAQLAPAVVAEGDTGKVAADATANAKSSKAVDAGALLDRLATAGGSSKARGDALDALGASGPVDFDLAAWTRAVFGKAFPLDAKELKQLLDAKKYDALVEALITRNPSGSVVNAAARDSGLAAFARTKLESTRALAKKGLMAQCWVFPNALPKDEKLNQRFWSELSVSGIATSKDKKTIEGILLGGAQVRRAGVDWFVRTQLASALVMDQLADRKAPRLKDLAKQIDREREEMLRPLTKAYGTPDPRQQ